MRFADPIFLAIAAAASVVLVVFFIALARARRRALSQVGTPRLLPRLTASLSRRRRRLKQAALVTGVALVCVALARPQLGYRWEEAHRRGVDILFAIDTSKSMLTRDVKPNRLERAKLAVRSLVEKFPGDRVGLVVFAGDAFVETPLTLDHGIFDESVAALDTSVIPLGGTDIESAIARADKALAGEAHRKVLVLLTDGENLSGDAVQAAERAAKDGVVIYTLGVGTPGGQLVPEPGPNGETRFVRDEQGQLVTSRLDEPLLTKIARATGGDYRPLGNSGQGLEALYHDELSKLPQSDLASRSVRVPLERFQWPLAVALVLLGVEPLVSERRRRRQRRAAPVPVAAAVATMLLAPAIAWASPQSAERAYAKGDFATAERQYAEAARSAPADARLSFNMGAAAYRKSAYEAAAKAFESTLRSEDLGLQEQAYYNLGNASFRLGEAALAKGDIAGTKGRWQQAVGEYENALKLRGDAPDTRYNLELVKRRLADLEKKQEEQKQQQRQQQGRGHGQQQQQQGQGQGQQQQGQGQQQQQQQGQGQGQQQQGQGQQQQQQPNKNGQGEEHSKQGGPGAAGSEGKNSSGAEDTRDSKQDVRSRQDQNSAGAERNEQNGTETQRDERGAPGELSKADAEALLDSLRGDLKLGSPTIAAKQTAQAREPRRDW